MGVRIGKQDQQPPCPRLWSGPGTLSSYAHFIPDHYLEGTGDSHHAPSHPCVLQPQLSLEAGVACPPHALKTHISLLFHPPFSLGLGFLQRSCTEKAAMSSLEQSPICSLWVWLPFL